MKYLYHKIILVIFFFLIIIPFTYAASHNNFEGSIRIVETNLMDTIYYDFQVKQNLATIWMHDKQTGINKKYIANLDTHELFELNKKKKVYIKYPIDEACPQNQEKNYLQIKKTDNYKFINRQKCYQWIVTNKLKNTSVSYWVAKKEFSYLFNIIVNLKACDKQATYFMFLPNFRQFFPYESVERGLLREFRSQDQLVSVKEKQISDKIFVIPKDYTEVK